MGSNKSAIGLREPHNGFREARDELHEVRNGLLEPPDGFRRRRDDLR